jgi:hypothetical protein
VTFTVAAEEASRHATPPCVHVPTLHAGATVPVLLQVNSFQYVAIACEPLRFHSAINRSAQRNFVPGSLQCSARADWGSGYESQLMPRLPLPMSLSAAITFSDGAAGTWTGAASGVRVLLVRSLPLTQTPLAMMCELA